MTIFNNLLRVPKLHIKESAFNDIRRIAKESSEYETGGILIGTRLDDKLVINVVSGPGPKATHARSYFLRDTEYCQAILDEQHAQSKGDYIGEWHSHIVQLEELSAGDISTLARIMNDADYKFASFAMLLAIVKSETVTIKAFVGFKLPKECGRIAIGEATLTVL